MYVPDSGIAPVQAAMVHPFPVQNSPLKEGCGAVWLPRQNQFDNLQISGHLQTGSENPDVLRCQNIWFCHLYFLQDK